MPVTAIIAIQSEYSMMEWMFEKDVIPTCEKLSIGFVPFSPLASGFLSGKYKADRTYTGDDVRRVITRFSKENVLANQPLLDLIGNFANQKGILQNGGHDIKEVIEINESPRKVWFNGTSVPKLLRKRKF